jgi:hypothetical protein
LIMIVYCGIIIESTFSTMLSYVFASPFIFVLTLSLKTHRIRSHKNYDSRVFRFWFLGTLLASPVFLFFMNAKRFFGIEYDETNTMFYFNGTKTLLGHEEFAYQTFAVFCLMNFIIALTIFFCIYYKSGDHHHKASDE